MNWLKSLHALIGAPVADSPPTVDAAGESSAASKPTHADTNRDRELVPRSWMSGRPMTRWESRALHATPPSFVDYLKYRDWDRESGCFILSDARSAGFLWELTPAPTEGRDPETLKEMQDAFSEAVRSGINEDPDSPWIAQFFVQDEDSLHPHWRRTSNYIAPALRETPFNQHWMAQIDRHLQQVAQPGGIFPNSSAANAQAWRGKERRVFVTLYRLAPKNQTLARSIKTTRAAASQFESSFAKHHVQLRGCRGLDLYEWLTPWLNPSPALTGGDPYAYIRQNSYPDEVQGNMPPEWDLGEATLRSPPELCEDGVWKLQDTYTTALTVHHWSKPLQFGHLTGEDRHSHTLMDQMPSGTRISTTVIAEPQFRVNEHLAKITKSAIGNDAHVDAALKELKEARDAQIAGQKLFRVQVVVYISAPTLDELNDRADACTALLNQNGLPTYPARHDLFRSATFLSGLPYGFDHALDRAGPRRSTLQFSGEIAKLLPLAGRSTGTGSPCITMFNRGAQPLSFDPLANRQKNAHLTVFGPTGAGKSAWVVNALLQVMVTHRPYLWLIDPKWPAPSYSLLVDYFEAQGLSVNRVRLTPDADVALNPFHFAIQALEVEFDDDSSLETDSDDVEGGRDLMGEMVILAIAMVTGGEKKEMERIDRADRPLFSQAIRLAAQRAKDTGRPTVITEDIARAIDDLADETLLGRTTKEKYHGFANAMRVFCEGTAGRLFNRPGTPWPTSDVTLVEFATLGTTGYEDQLSVGFMSLIQAIQLHITRHQYEPRQTVVLVDESHVLARMEIMARYVMKAIKTWRSAGAWYWQATQSIDDFSGDMSSLTTQMEWMIALAMPKDEVTKLRALKSLTDEQATMVASARKSPGEYSEGVVLHDSFTALFRAVIPPLALALAQTEKDERAARRAIMAERSCSEIEATYEVARRIEAKRASHATRGQKQPWRDRR